MNEAKDFVVRDAEEEAYLDVSSVIEAHRSNVIDPSQAKRMAPVQALQQYYMFAQQQLDIASGRNAVSAEALYCLGKLHTVANQGRSQPGNQQTAKAIVFHQAALQSDSNNYRSANELGVLLARTGQLAEATKLFKQSLLLQPSPQTWNNLAKTHQRLGEESLAQLATTESLMTAQNQIASANSGIRWMPASQFNASAPIEYHERVAAKETLPPPPSAPANNSEETESKQPKSFSERLKSIF